MPLSLKNHCSNQQLSLSATPALLFPATVTPCAQLYHGACPLLSKCLYVSFLISAKLPEGRAMSYSTLNPKFLQQLAESVGRQ